MKTILTFLVCLCITGNILSQEQYVVPVRTVEEKYERTLFQFWIAGIGGGMHYAKTHGTTPYEFGKYLGTLFAPGWGNKDDFNALINGSLMVFEESRPSSSNEIVVHSNPDGSVSIITDEKMWHRYFRDEPNDFITFKEFTDFMNGLTEAVAGYLGATSKIDLKDASIIFTYTKK